MRPSFFSLRILGLLFLSIFIFTQPSWAGRVGKIKGKRIYIKLSRSEAETIKKGDKLYLTTKSGKKKAIVIVRKKKGRLVLGLLKKGKARKGLYTKLRGKKKRRKRKEMDADEAGYEDASTMAQVEEDESGGSDLLFGLLGGYGSASQTVTTSGNAFDTTGSSIAVKGLIDYSLFEDLGIRARVGLEMFNVSGTNASNLNATTEITYLSIDMLLRYHLVRWSSFGLFINGGMGIYSPMSKTSTNSLDAESISTTSILIFGGGASFPMGSWEIFAGLDYYYFPPSEDVSTSVLSAKVGILFEL